MPTYLGEEVGQDFLDMIVRVYKQQKEAVREDHAPVEEDDATVIAHLERYSVHGGPGACRVAREGIEIPPDPPAADPQRLGTGWYPKLVQPDDDHPDVLPEAL